MINKIDQNLSFVNTALNLRSKRQEVLAANLANADTPNYKARDMDFASSCVRPWARPAAPWPWREPRRAISRVAAWGAPRTAGLKFRAALQPSLDGNTVDPDVERAHFAENTVHYQFLLERARGKFDSLKQALAPEK